MKNGDPANDVLYAAPLEAFVAERTRLVADLRKAGDRAGAALVAKASKPTVSAWAVNQLARRERALVDRFVEAGARLRDAQLAAAGREAFAAASAVQRDALVDLRQAAERILVDGGHGAAPAVLERVMRNLRAASASEEIARQIQAGCLVADLPAESLDPFAALASVTLPERSDVGSVPHPPARSAAPDTKAEEQRRARELAERERELARARRVAEESAVRASRTREAATRARRAADEAEEEARRAQAADDDARRALADAQAALAALR